MREREGESFKRKTERECVMSVNEREIFSNEFFNINKSHPEH